MNDVVRVNVWSGPRNVSTALMYSFRERPDTTVVDEPLYGHYLRATGVEHPGGTEVLATMQTDGDAVVATMMGPWPTPVVMFKQMAHHLVDLDEEWVRRCRNALLVREPTEVLASYTEQVESPTLDMLGYPTQVRMLREAEALGQELPVVDSRLLLSDPPGVLAALCAGLGLGFMDRMLSWPAGPKPEDGSWAAYWYASVHRSTGFASPSPPRTRDDVPVGHHHILDAAQPLYEELRSRAIGA